MPTISVVIPNYNNGKYLSECLQSLATQTYNDFEIIIVDDGSTDDSVDVLNKLKEQYANLIVVYQTNSGPARARNTGVKVASADYVAFLDADDLWLPLKLERQIQLIKASGADLIYSKYLWFNKTSFFPNPQVNDSPLSPFDFWFDSYLAPSTILINKKKLIEIGGWNEELKGAEDMDLWFRIAINKLKVEKADDFDVRIRIHDGNTKSDYKKMYDNHINSYNTWIKLAVKKGYAITQFLPYASKKLSKARYYAIKMNRRDLAFKTFIIGFKTLGLRFINKVTIVQMFKLSFLK